MMGILATVRVALPACLKIYRPSTACPALGARAWYRLSRIDYSPVIRLNNGTAYDALCTDMMLPMY